MATTIQDNVNNYYFKNQADFEAHKAEIPNNSTIYIEETGEVNVEINGTETENVENLTNIVVGDKTYKVTGGTSVSTNGLNVTQEVLWTNANPSQTFNSQSVNLSSSKADYDYILFSFYNGTGQEKIGFKLATPAKPPRLDMPASDGAQVQIRQVSYINDVTVSFEKGIVGGNTDNTSIIPYQIIGLKFQTHDYSTEEQYTGKHWIDGKKIYQKTFIITTTQVNVTVSVNFDCSNVDTVIDTLKNNKYYVPNFYSGGGSDWYINRIKNQLSVKSENNEWIGTFNITIQYTKTTE